MYTSILILDTTVSLRGGGGGGGRDALVLLKSQIKINAIKKNNCSFEVIDVYRVQPLHTYGTIIWSLSRVHLFFLALVLSFFHAVLMTSRAFLLNGMRH